MCWIKLAYLYTYIYMIYYNYEYYIVYYINIVDIINSTYPKFLFSFSGLWQIKNLKKLSVFSPALDNWIKMSPENVCPRFKQNAWKKELCSNCFRPKEEHPEKPKRAHIDYKPLPEISPAQVNKHFLESLLRRYNIIFIILFCRVYWKQMVHIENPVTYLSQISSRKSSVMAAKNTRLTKNIHRTRKIIQNT